MLPAILGMAASSLIPASVMPAFMASALGTGIGTLLQGGSGQDALQSAALGGLGGFLGGKMGGIAGGENIAGGTMPGYGGLSDVSSSMSPFGPGLDSALHQQLPANIAGTQGIGSKLMEGLTRPEAIGTGLGGLAASSMQMPEYKKPEDDPVMPRGMPIKNTSVFPEMGYDGGKKGEFDYRIAKNFAEGGPLEDEGMAPMDMGLGGMTEDGMNDKELISGAIDVIQGEISDPDQQKVILAQFVSQFGQEALQDLVAKVQSGDIPAGPQEGDGKIEGAGDGMADMVPATMEGDQDVLLSDGEFVVPADVVSGIGNGSSDAGSNKLEDMMDRVRELRTGGTTQPPAIPDEMMLPA
jgi:hypothetical protein